MVEPESVERLGARYFVNQVKVDIEERRLTRSFGNDV
jgi:hypothetical protein